MTTNAYYPPVPSIFDVIVTPATVRRAVRDTLRTWSATYIAEVAAQTGADLSPVQDWTVRHTYRTLPASASPACWVTGLGTVKPPIRKGDGRYLVAFAVEVSLLVFGADFEDTEDDTGHYAAAVIAALVQHPDLGGVAQAIAWTSYRYVEVEHSSTRTLGVGRLTFTVTVDDVVNAHAGPAAPEDDLSVPPLVQTIRVDVGDKP